MNILVTGGAGYIGSVLVPALLHAGHSVTVVDSFLYAQSSLLDSCFDKKFSVIRADCRDAEILKSSLGSADCIIPLAAIVGFPACEQNNVAARSTNLDAVRLLLSLRSKQQLILYPCTNSGYGIGSADTVCTERTPLNPISLYGRTKVEAESAILSAGNAITFRFATIFGLSPRMRIDLLVNDFVYRAVNDRFVVVFEGHARRNYLHIRDAARVFLHGVDNFSSMKNEPYNVGLSDANLSKLQLCEVIKRHIPAFSYVEAGVGEDPDKRDYIVSNEKIEQTGFHPRIGLDEGIEELRKGFQILKDFRYRNC